MVGRFFAAAVLCVCVVEYSARRPVRALLAGNGKLFQLRIRTSISRFIKTIQLRC